MEWKKATFNVPTDLLSSASGLITGSGEAARTVAFLGKQNLELMAIVQEFLGDTDSAITAAADGIKDVIPDDFLYPESQASAYLLDIPLINPNDEPRAPKVKSGSVSDILMAANITKPSNDIIGNGGNYGLYRDIIESIFDPGDPDKPVFGEDCEMGALVVVYGSERYPASYKISMELSNLFGDALSLPPDIHLQPPIPQNVKVSPASSPSCMDGLDVPTFTLGDTPGDGPSAVTVRWDKPAVLERMPGSTITYQINSWQVYLKEGDRISAGENLEDYRVVKRTIPEVSNPTIGVVLQEMHRKVLIADLDPDKKYYVSVAFTVTLRDEENETEEVIEATYKRLSEQVRVRLREHSTTTSYTGGEPPDWKSFQSPMFIVPQLRDAYDKVNGVIDTVSGNLLDSTNEIDSMVENLTERTDDFIAKSEEISASIDRIANTINSLDNASGGDEEIDTGLWCTSFEGEARKPVFMAKIKEALLNEDLDNHPPFNEGDEYVGALVFLVIGQTLIDVRTLLTPIINLFGGGEGVDSPLDDLSDNPAADAGIPGSTATNSMSDRVDNVSPGDVGFHDEDEEDEGDPSLDDVDVDDDPC